MANSQSNLGSSAAPLVRPHHDQLARLASYLPLLAIAAVIAAYALRLLSPPTFWLDEAMLAVNIQTIAWSELLDPLPFYDQIAPLAYVTLLKAIHTAAGLNEALFRLPSFLALVASLALIARLPDADRTTRITAAALLVGGFTTVRLATDAKPYLFEVFFALALITAFHPRAHGIWRNGAFRLTLLALAAISTTAFPIVCLAIGGPAILTAFHSDIKAARAPHAWQSLRLASIFVSALAIYVTYFLGYLAESLRLLAENHAYAFAADGYSQGTSLYPLWFTSRFFAILMSHWSTAPVIIAVLLAAGITQSARQKAPYAAQFAALIAAVAALNLTGHLPVMEGRFSSFMLPWLTILAGFGASLLVNTMKAGLPRQATLTIVVLLALSSAANTLRDPFHQQARASLTHIAANPAIPLVTTISAQPIIDLYLQPAPTSRSECAVVQATATTTRCTAGKTSDDGAFQSAATKWYLMNYIAVGSWGGGAHGFPGASIDTFTAAYYDWLAANLRAHKTAFLLVIQGNPSQLSNIQSRLPPGARLTRIIDERPPSPTLAHSAAQLFLYEATPAR